MCGIAGMLGQPDQAALARMLEAMAHRGPDGRGVLLTPDGRCGLGHNRLAIIDLAGGSQPMSNEDGSLWLVANGEIYNHAALRAELAKRHTFRTGSDSEVMLHLFEEEGPDFVRRLDGMFAVAIYSREHGLLLARDHLGIKPLYFGTDHAGNLRFASEIKALVHDVREIESLPPGHLLRPGRHPVGYWHVPRPTRAFTSEDHAAGALEQVLIAAVRKRMAAEVPVGVFLSGGLDSSLIAAMARRCVDGPLHSFAVGLEGSEDLAAARLVARQIGTVHHERCLTPAEVTGALPEVIRSLESCDPALVRSAVPTWFVAGMAAERVKVVLSGEGADELFAGYRYMADFASDGAALVSELHCITRSLHNSNLQRVDRMTMARSIEGRVPFLDRQVVELAFQLHPSLMWRGGEGKWILRKVAERYLPGEIVWRPKAKFAVGTGIGPLLEAHAEQAVPAGQLPAGWSKEEWLYWSCFREPYGRRDIVAGMGRSRSLGPGQRWVSALTAALP